MFSGEHATIKINVAVDTLPLFHCCKNSNPEGGREHVRINGDIQVLDASSTSDQNYMF